MAHSKHKYGGYSDWQATTVAITVTTVMVRMVTSKRKEDFGGQFLVYGMVSFIALAALFIKLRNSRVALISTSAGHYILLR